ncbi:TetR/AcrR family transcriptional regulator [Kiloniella sp. b19]|uniref:TetR/AcrR family transcriptional regulator n=1 Tax=Kiloniella sp. GXU_MW_B19 TaxID=3141326 RepID=UPI0031D21753
MARPTVTDQRKEEILSAYERCIARFGVAGTTLASIADEAGLSRPLVRHHVGNQDDLLQQALERFMKRTGEMLDVLQPEAFASIDGFVDLLFQQDQAGTSNDTLIASAFIIASVGNPDIRSEMQDWLQLEQKWMESHFDYHFPKAPAMLRNAVAAGVLGIFFNVDSLTPLRALPRLNENSKEAVRLLIRSLEPSD